MRFGAWNVRRLYRAGSLTAGARELIKYKLDLVGIREVVWDKEGMGILLFSMEKETKIVNWEQDIFVHHRILSAVKRVELVSNGML
jgi:hypothetical protein